jgi:MFS family permease
VPVLVVLAYVSLLALSLIDASRGPYYPDILQDLQVNATRGSLFFAVVSLTAFFGSWRSHGFVQRHSALRLLSWSSLMLGLGFAGIGLAPSEAIMLACCTLVGFSFGALNLAQAVLIFESTTDTKKRRRLYNGLHAMYGAAALGAPLLASFTREVGLTWRHAFAAMACLPVVVSFGSFFLRPQGSKMRSTEPAAPLNRSEWKWCLFFALLVAFYLWGELSLSTRVVLWLRRDRGYSPETADLYLAGFFASMLAGRIVFSSMSFHSISNGTLLSVSAALGSVLYFAGLTYDPRLVIVAGLAMAPFYPVVMDQVARHFNRKSSQALGFVIGSGSLAVVLMHIAVGYISDQAGLTVALQVCAGVMALLALILVFSHAIMGPSWSHRS